MKSPGIVVSFLATPARRRNFLALGRLVLIFTVMVVIFTVIFASIRREKHSRSFLVQAATITVPLTTALASQLGQDRTTILALQSVGAAMGNMVAIHNIVVVSSVLGLTNREGEILRKTVGPMLIYGVLALLGALFLV